MSRYGKNMRDCCDSPAQRNTAHTKGCVNYAAPSPEPMQADLRDWMVKTINEHTFAVDAADMILERLAAMQAKSAPVAWVVRNSLERGRIDFTTEGYEADLPNGTLLYAHPSPSAPNPDLAGLVEAFTIYTVEEDTRIFFRVGDVVQTAEQDSPVGVAWLKIEAARQAASTALGAKQ